MQATITNAGGRSTTFDADRCTCTWTLLTARQFGTAEVFVPRNSSAFAYVDDGGGQLVRLSDPTSGTWTGISDIPTTNAYGTTLHCHHLAAATTDLVVQASATYRNITAGGIAGVLSKMTLAGHPLLRPGTFAEAAPTVAEFSPAYRPLADCLGELANLTGQEWRVNESGSLDWLAAIGRVIDVRLTEGDQLVDVTRQTFGEECVAEVIARGTDGSEYWATSGDDVGWWRRQSVVDVSSTSAVQLGQEALATLGRSRAVLVQYQGNLLSSVTGASTSVNSTLGWGAMAWGSDPWGGLYLVAATSTIGDVREGDTLMLTLPALHLDGRTVVARVIGRTVTAGSPWIALDLVSQPTVYPGTLASRTAAAVLPAPADNVAGRLVDLTRRVAS